MILINKINKYKYKIYNYLNYKLLLLFNKKEPTYICSKTVKIIFETTFH